MRGSVALPAFTNTKQLNGTLFIQLNDNATIADIAAPVVVPVAFAAGTYSARDVARRIHDELFARGIGQAGAFPDGTVVVESRVNGLAGSVRIPAPGTGTAGAESNAAAGADCPERRAVRPRLSRRRCRGRAGGAAQRRTQPAGCRGGCGDMGVSVGGRRCVHGADRHHRGSAARRNSAGGGQCVGNRGRRPHRALHDRDR